MASPDQSIPTVGESPDQLSRIGEPAEEWRYRRIVVKAGTVVLTGGAEQLDLAVMSSLVDQIATLRTSGAEVILVTSGAVAAGRHSLALPLVPHTSRFLQK